MVPHELVQQGHRVTELGIATRDRTRQEEDLPFHVGRLRDAQTALADTDKISITTQRLTRELDLLLKEYTAYQKRHLPPVGKPTPRNEPTESDATRSAPSADTLRTRDDAPSTTTYRRHLPPVGEPTPRNEPTESDARHDARRPVEQGHFAGEACFVVNRAGVVSDERFADRTAPSKTSDACRETRLASDRHASRLDAPRPVTRAQCVDHADFVVDRVGVVSDERLADRASRLLRDRPAGAFVDQSHTGYDEKLLSERFRRYLGKPPGDYS